MGEWSPVQETKEKIYRLLDELPAQSLNVVEQFVEFVYQQAQRRQPVVAVAEGLTPLYPTYPTVENPASSLSAWLDLIPDGCGGDALADTESLYDEV